MSQSDWGPWEKHFLFFPKDINGKTVWLRYIYRKEYIRYKGLTDHPMEEYIYAEDVFEILRRFT